MEPGPPKIIERIAGVLIPPACREEVLGDLRESYVHTEQYIADVIHTAPYVIVSRIRRVTDPVVLLMEAVAIYTAFVFSAWWLDRALLADPTGYARLAITPAIRLFAQVLSDAYRDEKRPLSKAMTTFWGAVACAYTIVLWRGVLPPNVMAAGVIATELVDFSLRAIFPPIAHRPQVARGPAFWQKLELPDFDPKQRTILLWTVVIVTLLLFVFR